MQSDALEGINSKEGVSFTECLITIQDVLAQLNTVEELKCGYQLEEYICKERASQGFLPSLKLLNNLDLTVTDMAERNKISDAIQVLEKLPQIATVYIYGQGLGSQPIWYLNDEVGSIIGHSDTPNVKIRSLIHSPTNIINDPNRVEVSVMWPIIDIPDKHAFLKDHLQGFTE